MMMTSNEKTTAAPKAILIDGEEQGPRAQHLQQAFRKSLSSTIKRTTNDYAENVIPFNLTADKLQAVLNVMRNEMEAFSKEVEHKFQPIAHDLVPQLNALDSNNQHHQNHGCMKVRKTPEELVHKALSSIRLNALPDLQAQYNALNQSNMSISNQLSERHHQLQERLKHLVLKREVISTVLTQINRLSTSEDDGELEKLVESMRKQEYAKVL